MCRASSPQRSTAAATKISSESRRAPVAPRRPRAATWPRSNLETIREDAVFLETPAAEPPARKLLGLEAKNAELEARLKQLEQAMQALTA